LPRKPKRRFLDLQVDEVSVVDSPANESEFLVAKNLEEVEMGKANEAVDDVERVSVEASGGDDVAKALQHVSEIVDNITTTLSKSKTPPPAKGTKPGAKKPKDEEDEDDDDVSKSVVQTTIPLVDVLKAIGLEGESMKVAIAKLSQVGIDPKQSIGSGEPVKKTAAAEETSKETTSVEKADEEVEAAASPLTIDSLADIIHKAKRFTPERIAKLKDAYNTLKILIEAVDVGDTPKTKTPALGVASLPGLEPMMERTAVTIKNGDPVLNALAEVTKALGVLAARQEEIVTEVSSIKKARPDSNSIEDGVTETKKAKQSLWAGVL
jgi:hypothetical protein